MYTHILEVPLLDIGLHVKSLVHEFIFIVMACKNIKKQMLKKVWDLGAQALLRQPEHRICTEGSSKKRGSVYVWNLYALYIGRNILLSKMGCLRDAGENV